MKTLVLLAFFMATIPLSLFAQEGPKEQEEKAQDFLTAILQPKIQECKNHFDILPFFILAIGADQKTVNDDIEKSLASYRSTGRLIIPEDKKNDPVAVSCATYAEGMLASAIGGLLISMLGDSMVQSFGEGTDKMFNQGPNADEEK